MEIYIRFFKAGDKENFKLEKMIRELITYESPEYVPVSSSNVIYTNLTG
jgi:hypothetical protein